MGLFGGGGGHDHDRCRDIEAALRGRVSDLEEREERLLQRIEDIEQQHREREKEWVDRYTALLNPAAARMMAVNQRIAQAPSAPGQQTSPPQPEPVQQPDEDGGAPDGAPELPITPEISYRDRTSPVRPMPMLSPHQAGFRMLHPRRVPINGAPAPAPAPTEPAPLAEPESESEIDAAPV